MARPAPFEEMVAWQRGQASGLLRESAALAARDGPLPPLPRWRFGSVPLACAALLTPGPRDLAAMGMNLMDARRRQAVLDLSFRTSADALARLDGAAPRAA